MGSVAVNNPPLMVQFTLEGWSLDTYFGNSNVPVALRQSCDVPGVIGLPRVIGTLLPSPVMPFHLLSNTFPLIALFHNHVRNKPILLRLKSSNTFRYLGNGVCHNIAILENN